MLSRSPSRLVQFTLPLAGIVAALVIQTILALLLPKGTDFPYPFIYLLMIFGVAWFGGYLPGVASCLLTMVAIPAVAVPGFHFASLDFGRLGLLIGLSLIVSAVANSQRRKRDVLHEANEELDQRVQARTEDLAQIVKALESEVVGHKKTEERLHAQLERMKLLDQITRATGERQDLRSIFQVVIRSLEDNLPIDFGCLCLYDKSSEALTVTCVGVGKNALAMELGEQSRVPIDQNGLAKCVRGQLIYEPDLTKVDFPFPGRLMSQGLSSMVAAPLAVESQVFGVLVAARETAQSFSSGECEFLRQLSEHVGLAVHQAQVYAALQQAYDDLRQTQQSVMQQERLRALGQMASGIAHDINNAISPVALYTEILLEREPNLSPRTREYLETTQRAIEDVAHTVSRMREFYRQRESELVLAPVELNTLIQQVVDLTRARWSDMPQQKGVFVQLKTELTQDLPAIAGIESEIREALTNLVFNAVDAMPEGGTLTLRTKVINDSGTAHVVAEVQDTGIGMDEETQRRCLEPFFTTKGERGTGLGLAMVYGVAQRHHAEIKFDSTPGKGTVVGMSFPVLVASETGLSELAVATSVPARLRLLVVDDDPLLIKSLRDILEADGHVVVTANGGREGIDAFQNALQRNEKFALVMTDLGMPYVDGRKVSASVKAMSPTTPVILLTGWGQRLIAEGDIPPNVDRVLNKPPKLRDLRIALNELTSAPVSAPSLT